MKNLSESHEGNNANTLLAVVNYNSVGSWLEPYIGMTMKIIKKGVKRTWFEMDYGNKIEKCKVDSRMFNYC